MKKKKLGTKHLCFQCGCKFYDLGKPQPLCPKCGADQTEVKKRTTVSSSKQSGTDVLLPSPRSRRRKPQEDAWDGSDTDFHEGDDDEKETFDIDGLSLVQEDELEETEDAENP